LLNVFILSPNSGSVNKHPPPCDGLYYKPNYSANYCYLTVYLPYISNIYYSFKLNYLIISIPLSFNSFWDKGLIRQSSHSLYSLTIYNAYLFYDNGL